MNILCPISPGELIDKITILEIKAQKIKDSEKIAHVSYELVILKAEFEKNIAVSEQLGILTRELSRINRVLWDIEDEIRNHESQQDFNQTFVELARQVYKTNDQRSRIKQEINILLNSKIIEQKSYASY